MGFPGGEHSQQIASYLLTTLVALGIIGNILLVLWRSFREHKILVMPLKLANVFGDLSEVITGLALLLLLLYQDLPEDGICKGGGYLLMFSTLISSGTSLVTMVVLYLWQVGFIVDRGSKRMKGNIKMCTIVTASVTGVVWFLGLFFGFLPLIASDIDTDSAYFYDCIPIRLPGQDSWVYSLIVILLICLTLTACFGVIIASFLKIQKLEKEFSDITVSQYRTQKRKSLMKRTVRLATVDVMRWIVIMCGVIVAFTGGSSMDRITLKWTLGYILAVGIAVHALLPLIIYLKNTPNKNCLTNKELDIVFQDGFEIPECFQDAKILSSWNKRSGILNLLSSWYHDRRHLDGVMKVFPLHQKKKWANEVKAATKLAKEMHTNVAHYLWASKENRHDEMLSLITGMLFGKSSRIICRAHCELGSLRRLLIDDIQQLTEGSLHSITLDVANGLSHLKSLGLLHNKLSAHCIYITGSFQNMIMTGVIADFEESKDVLPAKVNTKSRRTSPAEEVSEVFTLSQLANVDQNLLAPDIRSFALVLLEMVMSLYYFRMRPGKRDTVTASRVSITNSVSPNYQGSTASLKAKAFGETGQKPLNVKMPLEKSQDIFDEKCTILDDMDEDDFSDEMIRRSSKNLQKHLGLEADKQEAFENELNLSREATTGLGSKFAPLKLDYRDFGPKPRRDRSIGAYSRHSIKEAKEEDIPEETWDSTLHRVDNRFSPRVTSTADLYGKKVSPVEGNTLRVEIPPLKPEEGDLHVLEYSPNVSDFEDDSKRPSRCMRVDLPVAKSMPLVDSCRLQTNVNLEVDIDGEIDYDVVPYDGEEPPLGACVPIELTCAAEKKSLAGESVRSHGCESRLEYVRSGQSNRSDRLSAKSPSLGEDSNSVRSQGCESRLEYVRPSLTTKSDRSSSTERSNQSSIRSGRALSFERSSSRSDGCESRLAHYDRVDAVERRLESFEGANSTRSNSQNSLYDRWSRGSGGAGHTDRSLAESRIAHYDDDDVDESDETDEDRSQFAEGNIDDGAYQFTTVSTMQVDIDGYDGHPCSPDPPRPDAARVISVDTGEPDTSEHENERPSSAGVRMAWSGKVRTAPPEKNDPVSVSKQKNAAFSKGMKDRNGGLRRSLRDRLLPQKIRFQKNKVHTMKFANGPTASYAKQKTNRPINWNGSNVSPGRSSQTAASEDRESKKGSDSDGGSRPSTAGSRPFTAPDVDIIGTPEPAIEPSKPNVSVPCPDLVNDISKKDDASDSSSLESPNSSIALINTGSDMPKSDGKIPQTNVEHLLSEDSGIESSYYDDSATGRISRKRSQTGNYETVTEEYILGDDLPILSSASSKIDSEKCETDSGEANLQTSIKTDDNHKNLPRYFDNNKYLLKQTMPLKVIPKSKPTKQDSISFKTFELDKAAPNPSYLNNGAVVNSNLVPQSSRLGDARFNDDDAIYQSIGISLDTCGDGVIMLAKPDVPPRKSHQKKVSSAQNKNGLTQMGGNNDVLILWDCEQVTPPGGSRETSHVTPSSSSAKPAVVSSTTASTSGVQESVRPKNNIITVVKPRTGQRIPPMLSKSDMEIEIQKPKNLEDDLVVCDLEQTDLTETPVPSPVSFKSTAFQRPRNGASRDASRGRDVSLQSRVISSRADVVSQTSRINNGSSMAHWSRPNSSIYGDEFQERLTKVAHMTNHVNYGIGSHQICYCKDLSNVFDLLDFDSFINGDESKSEAIMETMFRSGKIGVIGNLMFAMMRVCWFMEQPPTADDIAEELQYALTSAPPFAVGHV